MAGRLAARVLPGFYEMVAIVERDEPPQMPLQRNGIPQGHHCVIAKDHSLATGR